MSSSNEAARPDADPRGRQGVSPPELEIDGPGVQNRLTVAFRLVLVIPQLVVMACLAIAAMVVQILGWFAALVMGRLPSWAQRYLCAYLAYNTRVNAYRYLLVDRYPPFHLAYDVPNYPVRIEVHPGRLNRLSVLFRAVLAIPAMMVAVVLGTGWELCAFFLWLAVLVTGRTPLPMFGAVASVLRYGLRFLSYVMLLTSAYPRGVRGDAPAATARANQTTDEASAETRFGRGGTRPLRLTNGARRLLIVFVVLGILGVSADAAGNIYRIHQHSGLTHHSTR